MCRQRKHHSNGVLRILSYPLFMFQNLYGIYRVTLTNQVKPGNKIRRRKIQHNGKKCFRFGKWVFILVSIKFHLTKKNTQTHPAQISLPVIMCTVHVFPKFSCCLSFSSSMRINHFLTRSFHFVRRFAAFVTIAWNSTIFRRRFFFIIFLRFLNVNDIMALKYVGQMAFDKPRFYILKEIFLNKKTESARKTLATKSAP